MYERLMYDICMAYTLCFASLCTHCKSLHVNDNVRLNACVLFVVRLLPLPSFPIERIRAEHQNA